jgi:hypothetical protein
LRTPITSRPISQPHLAQDPQDIALGFGSRRPDDKIGPAQEEEVQRVVFDKERAIHHLTDLFCRGGRLDFVEIIQSLGRRHVMRRRTDPADARRDLGHIFGRTTDSELLKAAQLRNLKERSLDVALRVQKDINFAVAL